jgi:hypothetical protein
VEQCFSAAADTCGQDRGGLAARTIEQCVSSHEWLVQGLNPDGVFEEAQEIINEARDEKENKKRKKIPENLMPELIE